jgi:hypothetical protein
MPPSGEAETLPDGVPHSFRAEVLFCILKNVLNNEFS